MIFMDKYIQLDSNIKDTFAYNYKQKTEKYSHKSMSEYSCCELKKNYKIIQDLLENIHCLYIEYFNDFLYYNKNNDLKNSNKANIYVNSAGAYISSIQCLYLNPINNMLNYKRTNRSILLGFISIILAIITIITPLIKNIIHNNIQNKIEYQIDNMHSSNIEMNNNENNLNINNIIDQENISP